MSELLDAMTLILDQVDYTHPKRSCAPWQPICEVLSQHAIKAAREAVDKAEDSDLNRKLRESIDACRAKAPTL